MDYEQKYRKLVDAIKEMRDVNPSDEGLQNWISDNVPELAESEDERIRKELKRAIAVALDYSLFDKETADNCLAWLNKQGEPVDKGEISDGFHTFNELYYYRMLYNAAFFNMLPKEWVHKSKKHNDGEECFGGGWFIVMANLPTGQISNHYELKDWDLFQIPEKERADKWDGHTPQEAAERLHNFLLEKQGCHKEYTFKSIPRLLDMIEPTNRAKSYCQKLIDSLLQEGYTTDAKIVSDCLKQMKGEKVGMATMDEQKSDWNEEDKDFMYDTLSNLTELKDRYGDGYGNVGKCIEWLRTLKDRVQPQPKQEWSEEDELNLKGIIDEIEANKNSAPSYDLPTYDKFLNWLESLKNKIKNE